MAYLSLENFFAKKEHEFREKVRAIQRETVKLSMNGTPKEPDFPKPPFWMSQDQANIIIVQELFNALNELGIDIEPDDIEVVEEDEEE